MQLTISTITFLIGLGLIVLGVFGGGIEIREVKIPPLALTSRILSVVFGLCLIVLYLGFRDVLEGDSKSKNIDIVVRPPPPPPPPPAPPPKPEEFRGRLIENGTITVREVKLILRSLGRYNGTIDEEVSLSYRQALISFQLSKNVDGDALVGPITYVRLREAAPQFFDAASKTPETAVPQIENGSVK